MTEFSKGQVDRLQQHMGLYRGIDFSATPEEPTTTPTEPEPTTTPEEPTTTPEEPEPTTTSPPTEPTEPCRVADPVTVTVTKWRWF